jgi:hypothetical protein
MQPDLDLQAFLKANRKAASVAVYDGQLKLGNVVEFEGEHFAFDAGGHGLGAFRKRREAVAAIPAAASNGARPAPSHGGA